MSYQDTSRLAYQDIKPRLNEKQEQVKRLLERRGPMTDTEISEALGWPINRVTPRRGELVELGHLEDLGTVPGHTGRPVHLWKVKTASNAGTQATLI